MATRKSSATAAQKENRNDSMKKSGSSEQQAQKETPTKSRPAKTAPVTVTFIVSIPENMSKMKRSIYLAGNFSQVNNKADDWNAQGQKMKKGDNGRWTLTIKVPQNTVIEYKYTLGEWGLVELDQNCQDVPNRQLEAGSGDSQQV